MLMTHWIERYILLAWGAAGSQFLPVRRLQDTDFIPNRINRRFLARIDALPLDIL